MSEQVSLVGKITPDGTITTYPLPQSVNDDSLRDLVVGSDGGMWFTIRDGGNNALKIATIAGIASPPALVNSTSNVVAGTPTTLDVLATLNGSADPATVAITTPPAHGQASVSSSNGKITYTADASYVGSDTLTYRACLSTASAVCSTATITFTVASASTQSSSTTTQLGGGGGAGHGQLGKSGQAIQRAVASAAGLLVISGAGFGLARFRRRRAIASDHCSIATDA